MNKAVIFDGDGTLWRPIGSDNTTRPDHIYTGNNIEKHSYKSLVLNDGVSDLLSDLRSRDYKVFVVSAHPVPGPEALKEIESKIVALGLGDQVDEFYCSDGSDKEGKTDVIRSIIKDFDLDPAQTYMIGDSYYYDYEAGEKAGVISYFIKNDYCKQPSPLPADVRLVESIASAKAAFR